MIYQALAGSGAIGQIVFGSDVTNAEIPEVVVAYGAMLDRLGVDDATRHQVMYGNMARILGLDGTTV
jgi:predicted TIM-barrel fold metal-dependent hydrolase